MTTPPRPGLLDEDGRLRQTITLDEAEAPSRVSADMFVRIGPAMAVIVAGLLLVYAVPALSWARPWKPGDPAVFWNLLGRPFEADEREEVDEQLAKVEDIARQALAEASEVEVRAEREVIPSTTAEQGALPYEPQPDDNKPVEQSLELFTGNELDPFFAALARSDAGVAGAITRVSHWGDSAIGVDGITGAIRQRMQSRFGDAGHGFHAMAPPNSSYRHQGIKFSHNGRWKLCFIIHKCRKNGRYGLGGATMWSWGGAASTFEPDPAQSSGHVSRFEIWYAKGPKRGKLRYHVDDKPPVVLETEAPTEVDAFERIDLPDGPHKLRVDATGGGQTHVYGVVLERNSPGVVWDGLALLGAFTNRLLEFNPEHLKAQLDQRNPHLIVLTFGGNDMVRKSMSMDEYQAEYRSVLKHIRRARPNQPCIVMSPLDHGVRKGQRIVSMNVVPKMVAAQREVAKSEGCAFYDTYQAMGGKGAAGRWFRQKPRLVSGDLSHVTLKGQVVIGEMFYRALLEAYVAYRKRAG